jgi:hypothetical protein
MTRLRAEALQRAGTDCTYKLAEFIGDVSLNFHGFSKIISRFLFYPRKSVQIRFDPRSIKGCLFMAPVCK